MREWSAAPRRPTACTRQRGSGRNCCHAPSCFHTPRWRPLEGDVTLTEVMSVEYCSDLSIGCSYLSIGPCVSARRHSRHPDPSRAMLPQRCRITPYSWASWAWWPPCRCCGRRRWTRLTLPLGGQYGPDVFWTQSERRALRRVLYVVVLGGEVLNKLKQK